MKCHGEYFGRHWGKELEKSETFGLNELNWMTIHKFIELKLPYILN